MFSETLPRTRPRVEGGREDEILDATLDLLLEVGYDRLTLDAVARHARASKATLYRRWETKARLVVEAMARANLAPSAAAVDTGTLRGDLLATFCGGQGLLRNGAPTLLASVITAVTTDPEFAAAFRQTFLEPRLQVSRAVYTRAAARGEISADLDLDLLAPTLAGIVLHRAFVLGELPDDALVERVVDHVILPAVGLVAVDPPRPEPPDPEPSQTSPSHSTEQKARTS